MSINERFRYLRMMQQRYRRAKCKRRGQLLDEMECMTRLNRVRRRYGAAQTPFQPLCETRAISDQQGQRLERR